MTPKRPSDADLAADVTDNRRKAQMDGLKEWGKVGDTEKLRI